MNAPMLRDETLAIVDLLVFVAGLCTTHADRLDVALRRHTASCGYDAASLGFDALMMADRLAGSLGYDNAIEAVR
ncbi:MAG: hypothetical protein ACYC1D_17910 [Acidimicrobiales bacterium]